MSLSYGLQVQSLSLFFCKIPRLKYKLLQLLQTILASLWFIALLFYHPQDPSWLYAHSDPKIMNFLGQFGAQIASISLFLTGYGAYVLSTLCFLLTLHACLATYAQTKVTWRWMHWISLVMVTCIFFTLGLHSYADASMLYSGGVVGFELTKFLLPLLGFEACLLLALGIALFNISCLTHLSWLRACEITGACLEFALLLTCKLRTLPLHRLIQELRQRHYFRKSPPHAYSRQDPVWNEQPTIQYPEKPNTNPMQAAAPPHPKNNPSIHTNAETTIPLISTSMDDKPSTNHIQASSTPPTDLASIPNQPLKPKDNSISTLSLDFLNTAVTSTNFDQKHLEQVAQQIESRLHDFGIEVKVAEIISGPVITRFEVAPATGVKGSQIVNLSKDLARALSVAAIRIIETIPGKTYMGLEVPNPVKKTIFLHQILSSEIYQQCTSPITLALGQDIAGQTAIADLGKMPHLLVAGATGSGKSVCINAMILSILYKASPDETRLIMIDPKMLELSVYEGIPHLLAPVVIDMQQAAHALNWCVAEMDRRYRLMAAMGVRNCNGFNQKIKQAAAASSPIMDPFNTEEPFCLEPMPFIIVIIDELADLMMVTGKKIEELIARLAQKARAAGIHLILATQRPSVDVITGLIKANIPSRIAFQVSSKIDSRTILDQSGAETLLGQGDMLYLPPGQANPSRIHGAFVEDEEIHRVTQHLKNNYGPPQYIDEILSPSIAETPEPDDEQDPLYDRAVQVVLSTKRPSISMVQRQLRIGYNRAARLVEQMERSGLITSADQHGSRRTIPTNLE